MNFAASGLMPFPLALPLLLLMIRIIRQEDWVLYLLVWASFSPSNKWSDSCYCQGNFCSDVVSVWLAEESSLHPWVVDIIAWSRFFKPWAKEQCVTDSDVTIHPSVLMYPNIQPSDAAMRRKEHPSFLLLSEHWGVHVLWEKKQACFKKKVLWNVSS